MERLVQYLDDLEDLFYATALLMERVRRAIRVGLLLIISFTLQFFGIMLALSQPPLALAVVSLMIVGFLYRSATGGNAERRFAA